MSCWCVELRQAHVLPRGQCCCSWDCGGDLFGVCEYVWGDRAHLNGMSSSTHSTVYILSQWRSFYSFFFSRSLSRSDFDCFFKYWFTPSVLFSWSQFFDSEEKDVCFIHLFSFNSFLNYHFFFAPLPTHSFFTSHPFSSSPLPHLSPTHSSSSKEGSLAAKRRHASSRFNFIFGIRFLCHEARQQEGSSPPKVVEHNRKTK